MYKMLEEPVNTYGLLEDEFIVFLRDISTLLMTSSLYLKWWLGGVTVRTLDLRSRGRGFNSRSGRYQMVSTWMGDCLRTGKPSRYITNHQGQLSLPSLRGR